ncbi:phosphoribosylglycinamide formyltransferase-1 [Rhodoligotrophos appendicifer]|uniref:phosphoribosylglycinamide formyltransferase n=1 Tax=Rhodoligotrophos appendicifer TaxID=987056 RepID=UPI00117DCEB9|nr:phosphoribosylglycinamide formyltransferase [Rhodoligotrophos appendicifer]
MGKLRVGVLISGRGSNLGALLSAAAHPDYPAEIALVISNRPEAEGLRRAEADGVKTVALDHKLTKDRGHFDQVMDGHLRAAEIELVCLAGYMRVLSPDFVKSWHNRMINIHPSLLPSYPGLDTHKRVLAEGGRISGCTVHFVRDDVDTGPIIAQAAVPVLSSDTEATLAARILRAEHLLYPCSLELLAAGKISITDDKISYVGVEREQPALFSPATVKLASAQ